MSCFPSEPTISFPITIPGISFIPTIPGVPSIAIPTFPDFNIELPKPKMPTPPDVSFSIDIPVLPKTPSVPVLPTLSFDFPCPTEVVQEKL